jgi:hypothetical protein
MIEDMFEDDDGRRRREIVGDGGSVRVGVLTMDALQKSVAADRAYRLARPGFRFESDVVASDRDQQPSARELAYRKMVADMSNRWRTPAERQADTERAADATRIETISMGDAQKIRHAAWCAMVARKEQAWKTA